MPWIVLGGMVWAAGCGNSERRGEVDEQAALDASPTPSATSEEGETDRWTTHSSQTETTVRLLPPSEPIEAGSVRFRIEVDTPDEGTPTSADLASPTMPMHGILRFPVEPETDGEGWVVEPEIPMEGRWALYVNLDHGDDAAGFEFDVEPGAGGAHDHGSHGGPADSADSEEASGHEAHEHEAHETDSHEQQSVPERNEHSGHHREAAHESHHHRGTPEEYPSVAVGAEASGASPTPTNFSSTTTTTTYEVAPAVTQLANPGIPGPRGDHVARRFIFSTQRSGTDA